MCLCVCLCSSQTQGSGLRDTHIQTKTCYRNPTNALLQELSKWIHSAQTLFEPYQGLPGIISHKSFFSPVRLSYIFWLPIFIKHKRKREGGRNKALILITETSSCLWKNLCKAKCRSPLKQRIQTWSRKENYNSLIIDLATIRQHFKTAKEAELSSKQMQHSWQQKGTAGHKVLLRTTWDMWYLKLSLINDFVRVKEWVAEGSDAGGVGPAKYVYRGCGLSRSPQFQALCQKNRGLGMTTIGTTATCVCAVIKKDESDYIEMGLNLLFKGTVCLFFRFHTAF